MNRAFIFNTAWVTILKAEWKVLHATNSLQVFPSRMASTSRRRLTPSDFDRISGSNCSIRAQTTSNLESTGRDQTASNLEKYDLTSDL